DHRDARRLHAARHLERLHVAAHRAHRPGAVHAPGGPRQPGPRARPGQRADDGRLRADDTARAARLPAAAALLHAGAPRGAREGMTSFDGLPRWRIGAARRPVVRHGLLALCLVIVAGSAPSRAVSDSPTRALDDFADVSPWTAIASDGARAS